MKSKSRSRIEYLIPTNTIIVLDSYFNLIINRKTKLASTLVNF